MPKPPELAVSGIIPDAKTIDCGNIDEPRNEKRLPGKTALHVPNN
jgi:hypothetical protein